MGSPVEFMLADLREKYEAMPSSRAFDRLYSDPEWGHMFAVLHKRLNEHFTDINGRAETTHHYWADNSRDLLSLTQEIEADLHTLRRAGVEVNLADLYQDALERCRPWLSHSGGSAVPEDFEPIEVIAYEPVLTRAAKSVKLKKHQEPIELKMVGSGSYAHVYSYIDPDYGIKFAVKRAKKDLDERDLERFKQEFETLKKLSFPYVVEVYRYGGTRNEYRMEYCDTTLREYIRNKNSTISFAARKRIALQFLYGINYLHRQRLLHRDISLQNILLKVFSAGAVLVKLSDFGLATCCTSSSSPTPTSVRTPEAAQCRPHPAHRANRSRSRRISPANPFDDMVEDRYADTYTTLIEALNPIGLAYLHKMETTDLALTRSCRHKWRGLFLLNPATPGGYTGPDQLRLIPLW